MLLESIPTKEELELVANYTRESWRDGGRKATDEETLACCKVFSFLTDLGVTFRLEMLTAWASQQYQTFDCVAFARSLKK